MFAIVAPEISQYDYLNDKAQTYSLKVMYVQGGKAYSDFSIGFFQMKPSFVEKMEEEVRTDSVLMSLFSSCLISKETERATRIERVSRLENPDLQMKYLTLFCVLVKHRFRDVVFDTTKNNCSFMLRSTMRDSTKQQKK